MYYDQLLPTTIKQPLLQDVLTVLPLRSQFGRRVFLIEIGKLHVASLLFSYLKSRPKIANATVKYLITNLKIIFIPAGNTVGLFVTTNSVAPGSTQLHIK
jgi:hypothetical protein